MLGAQAPPAAALGWPGSSPCTSHPSPSIYSRPSAAMGVRAPPPPRKHHRDDIFFFFFSFSSWLPLGLWIPGQGIRFEPPLPPKLKLQQCRIPNPLGRAGD